MFGDFEPDVNLTRIEEEVRRYWQLHRTAKASRAARASGQPHIVHQPPLDVVGSRRSAKMQLLCTADLLTRYRAMQGHGAQHYLGWSCHGLAVEIPVEQALGRDALHSDLEQFTSACRDLVIEGIEQDQALANRLGIWLDPEHAYATLSPQSIGAVWSALRRMWDRDLVRFEERVVDICPRCATPLATREATRLMARVESHSTWVHLPWEGEPDSYFLFWTPHPWMLVDMVALAAHPNARYAQIEMPAPEGRRPMRFVVAESALDRTFATGYRLVRRLSARSLRSARYRPAFTFSPSGADSNRVILSDSVQPDLGTGLQPVTPTYHAPSLAIARSHNLPVPELIDDRGRLVDAVTPWRGLTPPEAEPLLVHDLESRGLLFMREAQIRQQGLCPYCESPLFPALRPVWLLDSSDEPWILGRDRAWGAPLPIWACADCAQRICVGGLDDLACRTGLDIGAIKPHRPHVDRLIVKCEACGGPMRRVAPVVDEAFEAAVVALSHARQPGQSFSPNGQAPRTVILGLHGEQHGWLDNLVEVAALLPGTPPWDETLALHEQRIEPDQESGQRLPADALRWAVFSGSTPQAAERDLIRPLWTMAARLLSQPDHHETSMPSQLGTGAMLLDHWMLARVQQTIGTVTLALDTSDWQKATAQLGQLINDYCGWYHDRRRDGGGETLATILRLLAPFVPHLAEAIYLRSGEHATGSIHLEAWPVLPSPWEEPAVLGQVALLRQLEMLGQQARKQAEVEADRLLPLAVFGPALKDAAPAQDLTLFMDLLAAVLGAVRVRFTPDVTSEATWQLVLDGERARERDVVPDEVDLYLGSLSAPEAADLAGQLLSGRSVSVGPTDTATTLLPDEVLVSLRAQPGWTASVGRDYCVLLKID